jgi:hypothetical protein
MFRIEQRNPKVEHGRSNGFSTGLLLSPSPCVRFFDCGALVQRGNPEVKLELKVPDEDTIRQCARRTPLALSTGSPELDSEVNLSRALRGRCVDEEPAGKTCNLPRFHIMHRPHLLSGEGTGACCSDYRSQTGTGAGQHRLRRTIKYSECLDRRIVNPGFTMRLRVFRRLPCSEGREPQRGGSLPGLPQSC